MKSWSKMKYVDRIKWRIRLWWLALLAMLVYMVVVVELGGGDSRIMTNLASTASRVIFFGGIIYIICRIVHNKKLLRDREMQKIQFQTELDERNQYLHEKSGGIVWDILLICLLFITTTTALFNMAAFYTAVTILLVAIICKAGAYWFYRSR